MWKEHLVKLLFSSDPSEINVEKARDLKYDNVPASLFRYKSFDNKKHVLEMLQKDNIWLSDPTNFNDPFDSSMKMVMNEVNPLNYKKSFFKSKDVDLRHQWGISQKQLNKIKKSDDVIREIALIRAQKELPKRDWRNIDHDEIALIIESIVKKNNILTQERWKKLLSISCFSETNKSILMWSHYAKNHEGFCVEYNFSELDYNDYRNRFIFPVIYTDSFFNITDYIFQPDNDFVKVLASFSEGIDYKDKSLKFTGSDSDINNMFLFYAALNKFKDWQYEKEWRFISPFKHQNKKFLYFRSPKPKAIYLGAFTKDKDKQFILKIGEKRGIPIYQMETKQSIFALEPILI